MFTIKYRQTNGVEYLSGGYDRVTFGPAEGALEHQVTGWTSDVAAVQFGPVIARSADDTQPVVWVMNEQGATVAKYDL